MSGSVELLADPSAALAEGPVWHARRSELWWVDIPVGHVHRFQPATGHHEVDELTGTVGGLAICDDDCVLAAVGHTLRKRDQHGNWRQIAELPHPDPRLRFNDGSVDPIGRFVVGTTATSGVLPAAAALWSFGGPSPRLLRSGVTISNGIGWLSHDEMVYVDTPTQRLEHLEYDSSSGAIGRTRSATPIDPALGAPDGLAVDNQGGVWVALWGGSAVHRYLDGHLDAVVEVPAALVTSVAFFGEQLELMAITTAQLLANGLPGRPGDHGGAIFVHDPGLQGQPLPKCVL